MQHLGLLLLMARLIGKKACLRFQNLAVVVRFYADDRWIASHGLRGKIAAWDIRANCIVNSLSLTGSEAMVNPESCVRLYTDEFGDSHFEDMQFPMSAIQYAPPAPAVHLSEPISATRFSWFRFPADWNDAAHPSPRRQLFIVLSGEVEGWTSTGDKRIFSAGDCLLMEDTTGKGHGARSLNGEARAVVVALE